MESGKLPEIWKTGNITAIHKKGPKNVCNNYRPVSLTSILCKVLESIIRDEIMAYMTGNNMLSNKQYGFLPQRSTTQQLLKIMDEWTECLDQGKPIESVYMDFMKAFDTVPHHRLLEKLRAYGIEGKLRAWIGEFLINRIQRVRVNTAFSSASVVTSGVPQGSVLGPALFVIYINDLPIGLDTKCYMFADDTKLYRETDQDPRQEDKLQNDLMQLQRWSDKWLLRFHPDKCKRLFVHANQQAPRRRQLYLTKTAEDGNTTVIDLETVESHKDLGIRVDEKIQFRDHINDIVSKANQMMGLIRRTFKELTKEVFIPLYKALVRSRLEYGQAIWSPDKLMDIRKIEGVQRRATKQVKGLRNLSYPDRLRALNLPTLSYRRLRGDMIEMYKIMHDHYDKSTTINITPMVSNLRGHKYKVFQHRASTELRKHSFRCRTPKHWNPLPKEVAEAPSIQAFERRLDKHWQDLELKFNPQ